MLNILIRYVILLICPCCWTIIHGVLSSKTSIDSSACTVRCQSWKNWMHKSISDYIRNYSSNLHETRKNCRKCWTVQLSHLNFFKKTLGSNSDVFTIPVRERTDNIVLKRILQWMGKKNDQYSGSPINGVWIKLIPKTNRTLEYFFIRRKPSRDLLTKMET